MLCTSLDRPIYVSKILRYCDVDPRRTTVGDVRGAQRKTSVVAITQDAKCDMSHSQSRRLQVDHSRTFHQPTSFLRLTMSAEMHSLPHATMRRLALKKNGLGLVAVIQVSVRHIHVPNAGCHELTAKQSQQLKSSTLKVLDSVIRILVPSPWCFFRDLFHARLAFVTEQAMLESGSDDGCCLSVCLLTATSSIFVRRTGF